MRPRSNAQSLINSFNNCFTEIRHLDYGGGNGLLSKILSDIGWNSKSYDPFLDNNLAVEQFEKFNFITAYEVFEHVPNVHVLMRHIQNFLSPTGFVLFSTLISDGQVKNNEPLDWWYAAPRNGHISLFSKKSLKILADQYEFKYGIFSPNMHIFYTSLPNWAHDLNFTH